MAQILAWYQYAKNIIFYFESLWQLIVSYFDAFRG